MDNLLIINFISSSSQIVTTGMSIVYTVLPWDQNWFLFELLSFLHLFFYEYISMLIVYSYQVFTYYICNIVILLLLTYIYNIIL